MNRLIAVAAVAAFAAAGCGGTIAASSPSASPTSTPSATARPGPSLTTPSEYTLTGVSSLQVTGTTISGATVDVLDASGAIVATTTAGVSGAFVLVLTGIQYGNDHYSVVATAPGYGKTFVGIAITRNLTAAAIAASNAAVAAAAAAAVAAYKASAKSIPYNQLIKDPTALAGTVVTYTAQVFQYDTNTTTSHFIASVTNLGYGIYSDNVWADVDPTIAGNVCQNTIIRLWGAVVGPYTYTTTQNGTLTIPEINVMYIRVIGKPC